MPKKLPIFYSALLLTGVNLLLRLYPLEGGRIRVDDERRTSRAGVWAGGDCRYGGLDLTVDAVAQGVRAAQSIDAALRG